MEHNYSTFLKEEARVGEKAVETKLQAVMTPRY
jgi:hypothetical protein